MAEYGLSQNRLAKEIGISPNRITEIVNNRRRITVDTALRLSLYFGNSPQFWINLQSHHDLKVALRNLEPAVAKAHQSAPRRLIALTRSLARLAGLRTSRRGAVAHQYGRAVPLTVVRSISRRSVDGKSVRACDEQRLSHSRRSPTRQTCS
jgi:antitoxin HigA-1